jgi:hypothetical protein
MQEVGRHEMLWRHFRREVTHCELFEDMAALPAWSCVGSTARLFGRLRDPGATILTEEPVRYGMG